MAISREKKTEVLAQLKDAVGTSDSLVFVNFKGISGNDTTLMRQMLRSKEIGYTVAKKSLTRRALDEASIAGSMPDLPGEFGLVYGKDLIAPAREIYVFEKKYPESLKITGGVFEGKYMSRDEMLSIATIPDTPVLRGMFVNIVNSPIQRFVIALDQIAQSRN
ncbi:MAG: 50S ribosomal protein L10 [Candidatus Zambryskibacteria bacterium CG10_big_fil_rev_8_21_14_0_10_42_12]|uniref:Large ribosomal subunit protein uL10 n=1 Tax=Candidatus Zambryskibacteria bacterium CG10_big_fil_rev_8_21_14_0_10_42_12 TaxID=1975115 RepID=A0A2H0QX24_9BACT|nr:MAG: 50S ribosomal protein L10 [Candidatus Zambryskibacteria bacterium CG10_big_fil_rev_8_21_14_0_10_42_12]